jgi:hypothetical protein
MMRILRSCIRNAAFSPLAASDASSRRETKRAGAAITEHRSRQHSNDIAGPYAGQETIMKATFLTLALALATMPAFAAKNIDIKDLAAEADMNPRAVAMVLGASGAYPEFKASYVQLKRKFVAAVGQQRYDALAAAMKAQEEGRSLYANSVATRNTDS